MERSGLLMGSPVNAISQPCASILPMFVSCVLRNPPDGANWRGYSASRVTRFQYVTSTAARSPNTPISLPTSHSVVFSGRRSRLPRLLGVRPGPAEEASGSNVVNFANAPGWRPDCPIAARSRRVEIFDVNALPPHPDNALGSTDMLALGYHTPSDVFPNALLRS